MTETTLPTLPKPPLPTFATLNYFKNQIIKKRVEKMIMSGYHFQLKPKN